jgi:hypothetical protein
MPVSRLSQTRGKSTRAASSGRCQVKWPIERAQERPRPALGPTRVTHAAAEFQSSTLVLSSYTVWLLHVWGRGRDEDCSSPPAQIRTCGFPASGSCLRSNVIGLRGIGYPCSSDPWARRFGDMLVPALCPGHALQLALPSTGRLPSTVSATDVTRLCSRLPRYYAAVRLLIRVHAHRSTVAFMGRSGVLTGHG